MSPPQTLPAGTDSNWRRHPHNCRIRCLGMDRPHRRAVTTTSEQNRTHQIRSHHLRPDAIRCDNLRMGQVFVAGKLAQNKKCAVSSAGCNPAKPRLCADAYFLSSLVDPFEPFRCRPLPPPSRAGGLRHCRRQRANPMPAVIAAARPSLAPSWQHSRSEGSGPALRVAFEP